MESTFLDLKFIYSEKATKFCETFTLLLSYVVPVKSKLKISQDFVAFSEYMNFTIEMLATQLARHTDAIQFECAVITIAHWIEIENGDLKIIDVIQIWYNLHIFLLERWYML